MKKILSVLALALGFSNVSNAVCFDSSVDSMTSQFSVGDLVVVTRPLSEREVRLKTNYLAVVKNVSNDSIMVAEANYPTNVMKPGPNGTWIPTDGSTLVKAENLSLSVECLKVANKFINVGDSYSVYIQRGKRGHHVEGKIAALYENGSALFVFDFKSGKAVDVSEQFQSRGIEIFPYLTVKIVPASDLK